MVAIFARTFIVYIVLSIAMKVMGKREIGELDVSELVSTLLISEIAAIPIDDPDLPLMNAIVPIIFIFSLEILISYAKTRFNKLKRYVEGEPAFIIFKGKISQGALRENRLSLNELLCEIRTQGLGGPEDVDYALLEQSGKISILKAGEAKMRHPVIIDGELCRKDGVMTENEILAELKRRKIKAEDVFYMSVDDKGAFNIIKKDRKT